jgi:hypothetical protein
MSVFSVRSDPRLYNQKRRPARRRFFRVEAGSNTTTVTLRVVGGDKKGSLESEAVKYGRKSHGNRTRGGMRWLGPVAIVNDRPTPSSEDFI